ncbi:hypothetical protein K1719_046064 [Acacia pycnantha]|nr:hypothetical protein K1719_046064 [Acacia pycnantha]
MATLRTPSSGAWSKARGSLVILYVHRDLRALLVCTAASRLFCANPLFSASWICVSAALLCVVGNDAD